MKISVALLLLCSVAVFGAIPKFPLDWSSKEIASVYIFQGAYKDTGSDLCCPVNGNCQVQAETSNGMFYFDFSHNRTRFDTFGADQSIVNLYGNIQKELSVSNNTCQEYCPLQGETLQPYGVGPNSTDKGPVVINGKTYELYEYKETLFGIIVMEIIDIYVDNSGSSPIPYMEEDTLTPFGQEIGKSNTVYENFKGGPQDPSHFDIAGVDNCPKSRNCNNNNNLARKLNRIRNKLYKTYYYFEENQ